jgi:hypothetical protein
MFKKLKAAFSGTKNGQFVSEEITHTGDQHSVKDRQEISRFGDNKIQQFDVPKQEMGFSDLISSHSAGNRFEYVAITNPIRETAEQVVGELHSSIPKYNKESVDFGTTKPLRLVQEEENYRIVDLGKQKKIRKDYVLIDKLIINYVPLFSFYSKFSDLVVCFHDDRYIDDSLVNVFVVNTNASNTHKFSLDYCVPICDLDKMSISFTTLHRTLAPGIQWATIQMKIQILQMDFPTQSSIRHVHGIVRLPEGATKPLTHNPRILQMTMNHADLEAIQSMRAKGEITDISKPEVKSTRSAAYANTRFDKSHASYEETMESSVAGYTPNGPRGPNKSDKKDHILEHLRANYDPNKHANSDLEAECPERLENMELELKPEDSSSEVVVNKSYESSLVDAPKAEARYKHKRNVSFQDIVIPDDNMQHQQEIHPFV